MAQSGTDKLSPLRTFAQDLEAARAKQLVDSTATSKPVKRKKSKERKEPTTDTPKNTSAPKPTPSINDLKAEPLKAELEDAVNPPFSEIQATQSPDIKITKGDVDTAVPKEQPRRDTSIESDGTVIADKKRRRTGLFNAVGNAFGSWVDKKRAEYKEAQKPKHTVTKAKVRRDVIKSAAKESAVAPRNDREFVKQRLERMVRTKIVDPVQIKPREAVAAPGWSHYTDEEQTLPTAPSVTAESKDIDTATPMPAAAVAINQTPVTNPELEPIPIPPEPPAPEPIAVWEPAPDPVPSVPAEAAPAPKVPETPATPVMTPPAMPAPPPPALQPTPPSLVETASAPQAAVSQPAAPPPPTPATPSYQPPLPSRPPFMERYFGVFATAIVVVMAVLGVGTAVWLFSGDAPTPAQTLSSTVPNHFISDQVIALPLGTSHDSLIAALNNQSEQPGTVQFYFTESTGEGVVVSTARTLLNTFVFRNAAELTRATTELSFGTSNGTPFMIFKVNDVESALVGVISWEQTMSADLSPWFGPTVLRTFSENSRAVDRLESPFFSDEVVNNLDVRILRDETGTPRITHTFIDGRTLLITTDPEQIAEIRSRLR